MMEETIKSKLQEFVTHSTELGETAIKVATINAIKKTVTISSNLIVTLFYLVFGLISIFFLSIAASLWLGDLLSSHMAGFLIVGGCYSLLTLLIFLLKKNILLPIFRNKIVKNIYE